MAGLKERIRTARLKAAAVVNQELILLYWSIGRDILARQDAEGWGARIVDRLAADLRRDFPEMTGLSPATSSTCEPSPLLGRASQLCKRRLHNCRGTTTLRC